MSNKTVGIIIAVIIVVALAVWGIMKMRSNSEVKGTADNQNSQAATDQSNNPSTNTTPPVTTTAECTRDFDATKLADNVPTKNQFVTLSVQDFGDIKVQLYDQDAPKTVENFLKLTHAGFYDCLTFHRVAKGFVIQGGDPVGNGTGGQSAFGAKFNDELNPNTPSYKTGYVQGILAMANSGPNTNGSQFFITLADVNAQLQKDYTIFGKVVSGMDVVQKIGAVDINPGAFGPTDGAPKNPVFITKATISSK